MTVYLEIDGQPVPASKCCWIDTAPCGCVSGVISAEIGEEVLTNASVAAAQYYTHKVIGQRYADDGFVLSLTTLEAFRAMEFSGCQHDPKWGVAAPQPPEGWQWGTLDRSWGRQTHIKHMVPAGSVVEPGNAYPDRSIPALCGAKPTKASGPWWNAVDIWVDCVPCRKCEAKAVAS